MFLEMDPGQDLLLAALSESGICPNDLFEFDSLDTTQSSALQQVTSDMRFCFFGSYLKGSRVCSDVVTCNRNCKLM